MTFTYMLLGLAGWTMVSVVVGLALGAIMNRSAVLDGVVPAGNEGPLRKSPQANR
jgi:hypothetical protein